MSTNRLEREIRALLRGHPAGIVCADIGTFRHRLNSQGHRLTDVEHTLRSLRNRREIRLQRVEGGTKVRLASAAR